MPERRPHRPVSAAATSTWGRRLIIRPGVATAAGGTGIGQDIGARKRLFDVRIDTARPGNVSKPFTLYATSRAFFDESYAGALNAGSARSLLGVLETGAGGITRSEQFVLPQHGKSIHIGADSVRMYVVYDPPNIQVAPDVAAAMLGFEVQANVSISGLYPGEVTVETLALVENVTNTVPIPNFSTDLQFTHPAPSQINLDWVDVFGTSVIGLPVPASSYAEQPRPIPPAAAALELTYVGGSGPIATDGPLLRWVRPS